MLWCFGRKACRILASQPGIEPTPCALKGKVLTTGPPGKVPSIMFCKDLLCCLGFPGNASGKEPVCQCRRHKRLRLIPGSGRSPEGGHANPLQYSCLENHMDRGAWQAIVHRDEKSWTWLKWLSTHSCTESTPCINWDMNESYYVNGNEKYHVPKYCTQPNILQNSKTSETK